MADTLETEPLAQITPRYFWRRGIAFTLDVFLLLLAFSLMLVLLSKLPLGIQPISLFNSTYCEPAVSGPLVTRVEALWPLKQGEVRTNLMCTSSRIRPEQRLFVSTVSVTSGSSISTRSISALVDSNGLEIIEEPSGGPLIYNLGVIIGMALIFAFMISRGGSTLGKRIFGLKVFDVSSHAVGFSQAVKREILKMLPVIAFAAIQVAYFYVSAPSSLSIEAQVSYVRDDTSGLFFGSLLPLLIVVLVSWTWWLWPMIFWHGQAIYDRISGCRVVRVF